MLTNTKKGMGYLCFAKDQQRCVLNDRPLCRSLGKRCETLCGTPGIRVSCSMITGTRCEDFLVVRAVITYRARRQGWGTSWGVGGRRRSRQSHAVAATSWVLGTTDLPGEKGELLRSCHSLKSSWQDCEREVQPSRRNHSPERATGQQILPTCLSGHRAMKAGSTQEPSEEGHPTAWCYNCGSFNRLESS